MADDKKSGGLQSVLDQLPMDKLKEEMSSAFETVSKKALDAAGQRITDATGKLTDYADNGGAVGKVAKKGGEEAAKGGSPVKGALKGGASALKDKAKDAIPGMGGGSGGSGGGKGTKATNIIEEIDVGVPISVAYNAWTEFQEWSSFMKKVDSVEQEDEVKLNVSAQVFWSHRTWEATVIEQVPDEKIIWRSKGAKGYVDGSVSFHALAPRLTRIIVVLEYYPQGFFEKTGNIWRAQGRRARLELKHFRRHVMLNVSPDPDQVEGWRGEIHDKEVSRSHDEVVEEEQRDQDDQDEDDDQEPEDEYEGEEPEDGEPEDEYEEDEGEEPEDGEPEDEYEQDDQGEEEESDEEDEEPEEDLAPRRRRRRAA